MSLQTCVGDDALIVPRADVGIRPYRCGNPFSLQPKRLLRKVFRLTAQSEPYRTYVRRQVRFVCLTGFFALPFFLTFVRVYATIISTVDKS